MSEGGEPSAPATPGLIPLSYTTPWDAAGIAVTPVFAADKHEALEAAKELFPGHRVTVVLKEGEPGT